MRQEFRLNGDIWNVVVWYLDDEPYSSLRYVEHDLRAIGCHGRKLSDAMSLFVHGEFNKGVTYSNRNVRSSVVVIGRTSSAAQCADTIGHEQKHLEVHICDALGIDPYGEESAYLAGELCGKMFAFSHHLICADCRRVKK